ncbi:MAG: hypothetical protein U9Q71_08705, partial [Pseudomonadota bacterium]|nr:hypothetical protein [Pseudomonadota bacterium]
MRLASRYQGSDNTVTGLEVEILEQDGWHALELHPGSPGFLIFVYSVFTCQHLYLRTNAAERGLLLEAAEGEMRLVAAEDWNLESIDVSFRAKLRPGSAPPRGGDEEHITERMKACPVSRNLKPGIVKKTTLT